MSYKILGLVEEVTVCDCCGKSNLVVTVALENEETGEIVHYGRTCAALAMLGSKSAKNVAVIELEARAMNKIMPLVKELREIIDGRDEAWGNRAVRHGRELGKHTIINGGDVTVNGQPEGFGLKIYWNGGLLFVPFNKE